MTSVAQISDPGGSDLFSPVLLGSPAATPTLVPGIDLDLLNRSSRVSSASLTDAHAHRRLELLIASALLLGAARSLRSRSSSRKIAEVSENPTLFSLQDRNNLQSGLGSGHPVNWWLQSGGYLRKQVIAETANTFSGSVPGLLRPALNRGINWGLQTLTTPATYRSTEMAELARSTELVSRRWADAYARQLGAGLGDASADGLLVSMATLQRSAVAERWVWQIIGSVLGLPHGQALSVTQIAQKRLEAMLGSRRPVTAVDLGRDLGKLLLSQRARRVAANEDQVAQNFGTQLLLMNAVAKGYLPADSRKVWVTAIDERVCPVCAPMDSVAVKLDEPFHVRAHHGVLSRDQRLWVPPAHPGCRCRIVPEKHFERGIITRTARYSRNEEGRARLVSQLQDLVSEARPQWMSDEDVVKAWSEVLHPRSRSGKFIVAGAVAGVAVRELADLRRTQLQTKQGYAVSSGFVPRKKYRTVKGVSDAPMGAAITQDSHPEGTYLVSSAQLRNYRNEPTRRPEGHMAHLAEAMRSKGFTQPIQIRVYQGSGIRAAEVWDGHHRMSVADSLGIRSIPATVVHIHDKPPAPTKVLDVWRLLTQRRHRARLVARHSTDRTAKGS